MDRALLDTDALSEILKGKNVAITKAARTYLGEPGTFTISVVTVMEVVKGLHKVGREDRLQQFLSSLGSVDVLPVTTDVAIVAGRIYGDLERSGQLIGRADPLIAATAIGHGLVLVTGNQGHFARIVALGHRLELGDWRS